jgi:hypothetical protein
MEAGVAPAVIVPVLCLSLDKVSTSPFSHCADAVVLLNAFQILTLSISNKETGDFVRT